MAITHQEQLKADQTVTIREGAFSGGSSSYFHYLSRVLLGLLILLPATFFFLEVQHSEIIFPFWDHCEFISDFKKLHDRTFKLHDLWAPHNHSRLLVSRAVTLANGLLTNWDIGSEYVYLEGSIILAFILQALYVRRLCGAWSIRCLILVSLLSVFSFSPAGHNNHWWSFMLQLDLTHLLVIAGFLLLALRPRAWSSNLIAALVFWLAAYTLGNGLVAMVAAAITVHLSRRPLLRLDRFVVFWLLNIISILFLYLPGLSETASSSQNIGKLLAFSAAYLGSPVASLFVFPYRNMFDVPPVTLRNIIFGCGLLLTATTVLLVLRKKWASASPSMLLFTAFSIFAVGSAFLTALGRADFDALGIANANASRYTIFGTYLVYAILYALSDFRKTDLPERLQGPKTLLVCRSGAIVISAMLMCLAANSYSKSRVIYQEAHDFNQQLAGAFWGDYQKNEKYVYPNADRLKVLVGELKRLSIGPYRFTHSDDKDAIEMLASHKTIDEFGVNGLRDLPGLGQILFSNPTSRFEMQVTPSVRSIHFSFGIVDNAITATPTMAGVEFRVLLKPMSGEEKLVWMQKLEPVSVPKDRGRQSADVPITVAEMSELIFETRALASPEGCWAYWQNVSAHN
jgi:hypothetical protein